VNVGLFLSFAFAQESATVSPADIEERLDSQIEQVERLIEALSRVAEEGSAARGSEVDSPEQTEEPEVDESGAPESPMDSAEESLVESSGETSETAEEG
jgi:hypothetical protein